MERKLATVLFADLVGSTQLLDGQDPEITRRRVTSFFDGVQRCIETHGGTVEKFAGDAVMAAFGIPIAHEDDADRAVRAGLGILDHVSDLGLEARVGIEAGEVVVGNVGAPSFMSYTIIGDPVNVAARLMQRAEPNEILVGPRASLSLHGVLGGAMPLNRRAVKLKGKAELVEVVTLKVAPA